MIVATFEIMVADGPGTPDGGSVTSMTGRRAAYGADDLRQVPPGEVGDRAKPSHFAGSGTWRARGRRRALDREAWTALTRAGDGES